jgi:hypothetical protein
MIISNIFFTFRDIFEANELSLFLTSDQKHFFLLNRIYYFKIKTLSLFKFKKCFYFKQVHYFLYLFYIMNFVSFSIKFLKNIS